MNMHDKLNWAPLYHGMQGLAIKTILVPPKLPKNPKKGSFAADPYYRAACNDIRQGILGLVETAESLADGTDSFFSSDAEYCFDDGDMECPADLYCAIVDAVECYRDTIQEYMGNNWNFGPGECPWPKGTELRYREPTKREVNTLLATQREYLKVLAQRNRDYRAKSMRRGRGLRARRKK